MQGYEIIEIADKKILQRAKPIYDKDSNVINKPTENSVDELLSQVNYIAPYTFAGTNIEEINIPDNILFVGHAAFFGCRNLKKVSLGKGEKFIPVGCFENCENLEELRLSEGLTHIGTNAFLNCRNLKNITMPSTIKFIGQDAFKNTNLKELNIPNGAFYAGSLDFDVNFYLLKRERDEYVRTVTDNNSLIRKAIQNNTTTELNTEKTETKEETNTKDNGLTQ